jgi:sec-independent protein translocase protein TatA
MLNAFIICFLGGAENPLTLIIIVFVILLLFGGKKIPELMRGLGKGVKEFKDASNSDGTTTTNTNTDTDDKPKA